MSGLPKELSPSTCTSPTEGFRKPAIMFSSVVFPAPFGPSNPVTPGSSAKEMPFTATTFPYQRETSTTSTAGPGAVPSAVLTGFAVRSGAPAARPRGP